MTYKTLLISDMTHGISVTLNRVEQRNSINQLLMRELHQVLDEVEKNPACRIIVLKGQQGFFCTGMDFREISQLTLKKEGLIQWVSEYMMLLKRFALIHKVIIAEIDGQAMAGGIGLVAASDLVIATSKSQFSLSEMLWGLLPANVMPYLIRRVGFQKAYMMTLTTQSLSATEAHAIHLVDELSDKPDDTLRKHSLRLTRLDEQTIRDMKQYFRKLWIIDEDMEQLAIHELVRLIQEPRVQNNIKCFIEQGKFPWEATRV